MTRTSRTIIAALVVLYGPWAPPSASAQQRFGASVEAFGQHALDQGNRSLFGLGAGGALQLELNLMPWLGLHGGASAGFLTSGESPDRTHWIGGRAGLRFHWGALLGWAHHDGWIDVHYVLGTSGQIVRSGFDVGTGYEHALVNGLRVGPFVRAQWASDPLGRHSVLLMFGISVGFFGDPRVRPRDADGDGVPDEGDVCPTVPQGADPDPHRPGCPAEDADGDGVPDAIDECPQTPQGANPDPSHPGCPLGDLDRDGVPDALDRCPSVHHGDAPDPERLGCPAGDRDGDGVLDPDDVCPDQHHGRHPDPARRGCPLPDRDHDTIPDAVDACPDEAGAPSEDPARHGCPGLVRIRGDQLEISRPVYFATNREVILEASFPVLMAVADAIRAAGIRRIRVEGHTDSVGPEDHNRVLSQRRAESVRRWLIEHGIDAHAVLAEGFGESRPVESNDTELGRAANRRVEFHILDSGGSP
ncbi:MAG: OmpA family protein [Myxococcales bacterium]|nr:OmpA family protein [Myxococcales bacterium]